MKTGWIIYPRDVARHEDDAFLWLRTEALRHGLCAKVIFADQLDVVTGGGGNGLLLDGKEVSTGPDFALMRTYEYALSSHLELMGTQVINTTKSMALCRNKVLTHQLLAAAGIASPETVFNPDGRYDFEELREIFGGEKFIVKKVEGSKGEGVFLVGSGNEMEAALGACGGPALCQRFVDTSFGRDLRVWTVGPRAVATVERYSGNSFLSNFSRGGKVRKHDLSAPIARLAEQASAITGAEFAGVDILFGPDGLLVNEVNGNAGFRTLSAVGENNIPAELFGYISEKLKAL